MVWDTVKSAYNDKEVFGAVDTIVNTITGELLGVIGLSSRGGNSVHYHEAWHYVNLLMLSEKERQDIYESYLQTHKAFRRKKPTNREVEEQLAEEFRNFVVRQEDTSLIGKIRRVFDNILDFVFLFRNKALYKQQFRKIAAGEYKNAKVSK